MVKTKPVAFFKVRNRDLALQIIQEKDGKTFGGRILNVKFSRGRENWKPKSNYNPYHHQNHIRNNNWYGNPQVNTV